MRMRKLYWAGLLGLAALGLAVGLFVSGRGGPAQLTLRMKPAPPLSTAACIREAFYGNGAIGARAICKVGQGRSWYHAVLTNHGDGAYPSCNATGFDRSGKAVFNGPIYFVFRGLPAGLFAPDRRSVAFSWYLPQKVGKVIARYVATCSVNDNPPI